MALPTALRPPLAWLGWGLGVHKMGSALEQGSVFHRQRTLVDPTVLKTRADLLGTTSPSALIFAALDAWRRQMVKRGKDLLGAALRLTDQVRAEIETIDGMHVNGEEFTRTRPRPGT